MGVVRVSREWLAAPVKAPVGERYLRLATRMRHEDSKEMAGIFAAMHALLRGEALEREEESELRDALNWFVLNLTTPNDIPEQAIFWFKGDAHELINQAWRIVRSAAEVWARHWNDAREASGEDRVRG